MFSKRLRKAIAIFLLLNFVSSVILPTLSYALTSGPTAPEFTSFEPVDTTDMVNLATGDLVYNMPLLEVPGPEGGYPISLSYHSGIMLNEEASWVGLGFTLNPGSISRTVNGTPDDHFGATRTVKDYDHGGERNTYSLGVGVPGANFGLSVSHDTNLGWGFGHSAGIEIPFSNSASAIGVKAGLHLGYDGFGGSSGFAGLSVAKAKGLSARVGISTNFNTVAFNTGLSYKGLSAGASLSSTGVKASASVAGASFSQTNSNSGRISTDGSNIELPIVFPNGLVLTVGYNYLRYWSDESSEVKVIGSLFAKETNGKNPDDWTFDSYSLLDPDAAGGIIANNDPEKSRGGSFPAYDFYNVNAQGVNGLIQPYIFDNGTLFRQNVKKSGSNQYVIKYNQVNNSFNFYKPVNFRFKNDFSNTYAYDKTEMIVDDAGSINFRNEKLVTPADGFNSSENHLAGSKHVQWFTNEQIIGDLAKSYGLMNYHDYNVKTNSSGRRAQAWARGANVLKQLGAFLITNESGVTYHYSLPVYAFDEYMKLTKIDDAGIFHEESNPQPYAYTWLLTAITGPDFVDRNDNGYVDESDWGYWVRFDYGKYSDDFQWRNPGRGFRIDIDNKTKMYSRGKKEIYYLNEISTRTHTAFFLKNTRLDGRSSVLPDENGGSFFPVRTEELDGRDGRSHIIRYHQPQNLLRLSKIFIVENTQAVKLGLFDYRSDEMQITKRGAQIIDVSDRCLTNQFDGKLDQLKLASLRSIEFETDYSLCNKTENSFEQLFDGTTPVIDTLQYSLLGKLTLNAVKFIGKGGSSLIPKTTFSYAKNDEYKRQYYDMWGFYKSDFRSVGYENLSRYVSNTSAENADTWCLTGVSSPLGADINIEYEHDSYQLPQLYKSYPFPSKGLAININKPGYVRVFFDDNIKNDLNYFFSAGDDIRLLTYQMMSYGDVASNNQCTSPGFDYHVGEYDVKVDGVYENYIEVALQPLYDVMKSYVDLKGTTEDIQSANYDGPLKTTCGATFQSVERKYGGQRTAGANVLINKKIGKPGGGVRVRSISVKNGDSESRSTNYGYIIPGSDLTSGTVSYEPTGLDLTNFNDNQGLFESEKVRKAFLTNNAKKLEAAKKDFFGKFHGNFSKLLAISREVPSPAVVYQFVTISETVTKGSDVFELPSKKVYEFQTFEESFINRTRIQSGTTPYPVRCLDENSEPTSCNWSSDGPQENQPVNCFDQNGDPVSCSAKPSNLITPLTLRDYSSWVGAAKAVTLYGANDTPLSTTTYEYLNTGRSNDDFNTDLKTKFKNQGVITQLFNENKNVGKVYSRKDEYPLVPIATRVVNHKTGVTDESRNMAFDFYTGEPTQVLSVSSYGTRYMTAKVPAYEKYPVMGLRVIKPENKNMLSQSTASYSYKVDDNNKLKGLLGASVVTWSDQTSIDGQSEKQTGIWREKSAYLFNGQAPLNKDGTYDIDDFNLHAFNWDASATNDNWEKISEVTLYDEYSHSLEGVDINNNFSSVKFDPHKTKVIASTLNGSYNETAYSGAEFSDGNTFLEGGVSRADGNATHIRSHSGKYSLLVPFAGKGFIFKIKAADAKKPYRASVWVYAPGESETQPELDKIQLYYNDGVDHYVSPKVQKNKSKSWYLLNLDIIPSATADIEIGVKNNSTRGIYLDDFRVHPLLAQMSSYVFDPVTGELTYILDDKNFYTRFEYDASGRLIRSSKELLNFDFGDGKESFRADQVIQEIQYNYRKARN